MTMEPSPCSTRRDVGNAGVKEVAGTELGGPGQPVPEAGHRNGSAGRAGQAEVQPVHSRCGRFGHVASEI